MKQHLRQHLQLAFFLTKTSDAIVDEMAPGMTIWLTADLY